MIYEVVGEKCHTKIRDYRDLENPEKLPTYYGRPAFFRIVDNSHKIIEEVI